MHPSKMHCKVKKRPAQYGIVCTMHEKTGKENTAVQSYLLVFAENDAGEKCASARVRARDT